MRQYVKPEITVKEYRVSEDIAVLKEYYYSSGDEGSKINVSLFVATTSGDNTITA